jgi:hypothetical protein
MPSGNQTESIGSSNNTFKVAWIVCGICNRQDVGIPYNGGSELASEPQGVQYQQHI